MHRPVLIAPPAILPVTVEEVRGYLPASPLSDEAIEGMIESAVDYLDGWTGILGRCLVEQTWRQDFDAFSRELRLPLGSVISVESVTWQDRQGDVHTVPSTGYSLRTDAGGRSTVRFAAGYSFPSDLCEAQAVAVTYRAGFATHPAEGNKLAKSTVPQNAKLAIVLMVQHMKSMVERDLFQTQESVVGVGSTSRSVTPYVGQSVTNAVDSLLSGLRVTSI